jgi:hypothetical protein
MHVYTHTPGSPSYENQMGVVLWFPEVTCLGYRMPRIQNATEAHSPWSECSAAWETFPLYVFTAAFPVSAKLSLDDSQVFSSECLLPLHCPRAPPFPEPHHSIPLCTLGLSSEFLPITQLTVIPVLWMRNLTLGLSVQLVRGRARIQRSAFDSQAHTTGLEAP